MTCMAVTRIKAERLIACLLGLMVVSIPLSAAPADDSAYSLDRLSREAEFVFSGEVIGVDYAKSTSTQESPAEVPHTFVTYRVDETFKSNAESDTVTLRFVGGVIDDDNFMLAGNTPLFDKGDKDLLFVKGNGTSECPLMDCAAGRFRSHDGMMFNDHGNIIVQTEAGLTEAGPGYNIEDFTHHRMSETIAFRVTETEYQGEAGLKDLPKPVDGFYMDTVSFASQVREAVITNHTAEELASVSAFKSADINEPFHYDPGIVTDVETVPGSTPIDNDMLQQLFQAASEEPGAGLLDPAGVNTDTSAPVAETQLDNGPPPPALNVDSSKSNGLIYALAALFCTLGVLWLGFRIASNRNTKYAIK